MSTAQSRPEKPKSKLPWLIGGVVVLLVALLAAFILPGLFKSDPQKIKLGVNDAGKQFWSLLVEKAAEEGIEVEIVSFTDYNTPNPALAAGDVDINKFQHVRYLAQHIANTGDELLPIGASEIYPIGFYSKKWTSVDQIPQGAEAALSNNPANQVRPLLALYNAGLIEFTKAADWSVTLDDVDFSKSKLGKLTPIDPTQTAASLDSVDIAFVDTPYAGPAGLTDEQQIYVESVDRPDLQQYVNIFAARAADADNPAYLKIVEIYHSDEIKKAIQAEEGGFDGVFKNDSVADLKKVLDEQIKLFK